MGTPRQGRRPATRSQKLGDWSQNGSRACTQRKKYGTSRKPGHNRWANTKPLFLLDGWNTYRAPVIVRRPVLFEAFLTSPLGFGRFGFARPDRESPFPGLSILRPLLQRRARDWTIVKRQEPLLPYRAPAGLQTLGERSHHLSPLPPRVSGVGGED